MDIAMNKDDTYSVYKTEGAPVRHDDGYETEPLFTGTLCECEEWCERRKFDPNDVRHRMRMCLVPPKFVRDVEARADKCMELIHDRGFAVESNITYRASAAWKEQPTHYAYIGDFGSVAKLYCRTGGSYDMNDFDVANGWLRELFGMATALWELGLNLTFDEDGKHTIFGNYPQWVTTDKSQWMS